MNSLRHMKQAKRIDNGEVVQGYLFIPNWIDEWGDKIIECYIQTYPSSYLFPYLETEAYKVDPSTIEDIAVKPIKVNWEFAQKENQYRHFCPNCEPECLVVHDENKLEYCLTVFGQPDYCPWCGQRLSWEVN